MSRTLLALMLLTLATSSCARLNSWAEADSGTPLANPFSFPLSMPETKPHQLEANDVSEIRETRYTQKDEQPVSPTSLNSPAP